MNDILTLETKKYNIKLENFEGPLDLLCYLIDKNRNGLMYFFIYYSFYSFPDLLYSMLIYNANFNLFYTYNVTLYLIIPSNQVLFSLKHF